MESKIPFRIPGKHDNFRAGNLKPGSIVESAITSKTFFDFFLVSQHGPLGTSRPTHYYVLHDDWQPDSTFWQVEYNHLMKSNMGTSEDHILPNLWLLPLYKEHQPAGADNVRPPGSQEGQGLLECPCEVSWPERKRSNPILFSVHRTRLDKMTEYELIVNLGKNMEKHADLDGMVFV